MSESDNMERHHAAVWAAIEMVAATMGVSVSRLAILAEHDATAMNKSKRITRGRILRWPSTLLVARIIKVAGMSFSEFGAIVDQKVKEQA